MTAGFEPGELANGSYVVRAEAGKNLTARSIYFRIG